MIVERLETRELDGDVERSAAFRWNGGETRVRVAVPAQYTGEADDASPFLPLALLAAMARGEDLTIDAPVSPLLLRGASQAQELYCTWSPALYPSAIEVAEERAAPRPSDEIWSLFSRGIDSTYSAARVRSYPGKLSRLVFVTGLDPVHDDAVRAEEVRRARLAAAAIGLPLTVVSVTFFDAIMPVVNNADDRIGAELALAALALGSGPGAVVVPSSDSAATMAPSGSSPVVDPLWSTEAVALVHDSVALGRVEKGAWIARERPDLLAHVKVCYYENRPDNCGRCGKCVLAMATFEAEGALHAAEQFPDEIDLDAVAGFVVKGFEPRVGFLAVASRLTDDRHGPLRDAILRAVGGAAPDYPPYEPGRATPDFRPRADALLVNVTRHGRPWPPVAGLEPPAGLGIVRAVDAVAARHVYGVGALPPGTLAAELGSLSPDAASGREPLWLTAGGYLATETSGLARRRASRSDELRWALAPLAWRGVAASPAARGRAALSRLWALARRREHSGARVALVGHLAREPTRNSTVLHSAIHPVTGDQLLSTNPWEANDMGYGMSVVLGHIERRAPITGTLEPRPVRVPWASRFGQRVRNPAGRFERGE